MNRVRVCCGLSLVLLGTGLAYADDPASPDKMLGTITVTGSRPADVAQTVNVLDAEAIANANLRDTTQLQDQIANLRIGSLGGRASQTLVSLRGFTNPYGAPESAVTLYLDGVPIDDFYFFDQNLFDVAHIAVYKGPQGTAFGANSEAGVIEIVTRKPDATTRVSADASVQSRSGYDIAASASAALSANVYGSLAAAKDGGDGYIDNLAGGRNYNGQDGASLRGRLVWQPSERMEFDAMLLGRHIDDDGGEIYLPVDRESFNQVLAYLGGSPLGKFDQDIDHEGYNKLNSTLAALSGTWKGDALHVRATASWRNGDARNSTDYDLTPQPWFVMDSSYDVRETNLELRADSNTDAEAPWQWLTGVSGKHRDFDILRLFDAGPGNPWQLPIGAYTRTDARLGDDNVAAFGQSTWRFGEAQRWGLTAGLRLERADRAVDFRANAIDPNAARLDHADSQALPKLALDYRLTPSSMIYASIARGWKPGGYNTDAFSAAQTQYRRETTAALEAGWKGEVGDALAYSLAAFRNRIHDYQDFVITSGNIASIVVNAPRASTQGVETTFDWKSRSGFTLGVTAGSVHATYGSDPIGPAQGVNLDGRRLQNVPRYNFNLHAQFARGPWLARVEWAGAGSFEVNSYDAQKAVLHVQEVPGYRVLNARLGYRAPRWSVWLYGANLTNKRYFLSAGFGFDTLNGYTGAVGNVAPPRTLGLEWRWEG
ncbi:MAG TPA: TonB-dependent receptor [Rudaea sp.]|nr:TonB-dependent receptor [Rudaea sp.]